ncbi:MAG: chemotaxis protein CheW [Myxococcota bacterium]
MTQPHGPDRFLGLPAEEREVLRARAKEVARTPEAVSDGELLSVLELHSRGQTLALPLSFVEGVTELVSLAAVPRAPPLVRGLVAFRGEVLIGLELSALIGGIDAGFADLRKVIAVAAGATKIGILAEKVISVRQVAAAGFKPDPVSTLPFVVGTDENLLSLLDPAELVGYVVRSLAGEA